MASLEQYLIAVEQTDGKSQRRIRKRRRGGVVLTREQVKAIKGGRKALRKEMRSRGMKSKEDFEITAASMGLYMDKSRLALLLPWLFKGRALWALLGALIALLAALFLYSSVTAMKGHFTINMSEGMFKEGFVLSETEDFENPTTHLFCEPAIDVPCISISHIPEDIDTAFEGQHNSDYFAYTYYVRNEGESIVDYTWSLNLNSESLNLSDACWVMLFEDGEMLFYAEPNEWGYSEALPAEDDDSRGYIGAPLAELCREPEEQYEFITSRGPVDYYRVLPIPFISEKVVAEGSMEAVFPQEVHKYTVVVWLEGDDPQCTDELIGGHVGLDMAFRLSTEEGEATETGEKSGLDKLWENLKFWEG